MASSRPAQDPSDRVYKLKYQLLKRCIKEIVLENAALCDRASDMQHQIVIAQEERKFLWKKFMSIQGNGFTEDIMAHNSTNSQLPEQKKTSRKPSASQKNGGGTPKTKQNAPKSKLKRKTVDRVNSNENV